MKKVAVVAALAVMLIGASAGVVIAQGTANPSSDVLYDPNQANPYTAPSSYAEGITIQDAVTSWNPGCNGTGTLTTTRLGDNIVQEIVFRSGEAGVGTHCSRAGSASESYWNVQFVRNTN